MRRTRAYRRDERNRAIARKKRICMEAFGSPWFKFDGAYSKGHIGCNCWMCKPQKHCYIPTVFELRDADHVSQCLDDYFSSFL